jgi:hypothetical protein
MTRVSLSLSSRALAAQAPVRHDRCGVRQRLWIRFASRAALLEAMRQGSLRGRLLREAFERRWVGWNSAETRRLLQALEVASLDERWRPDSLQHITPLPWFGSAAADEAFFMALWHNDGVPLAALCKLEVGVSATLLRQTGTYDINAELRAWSGASSAAAVHRFLTLYSSELEERFETLGVALEWMRERSSLWDNDAVWLLEQLCPQRDGSVWRGVETLCEMSVPERELAVSLLKSGSTASLEELAVLVTRL